MNTSKEFGVEIDLRSYNKKIYLHHEPFRKGEFLKDWIKYYDHKMLILNVKEEGLEKSIIKILKKNKIRNFFFHDQTFSTLLKNMHKTNVSIRYSEYEDIKKRNYLFKSIKWLWLDNFTHIELGKKFYNYPVGIDKNLPNIMFIEMPLNEESFFVIDDHFFYRI